MKIAVFTGTRAEYGLLSSLLKEIQHDHEVELQLLVTGMHLSPEFGLTYQQIEKDGFHIDEKIEILLSSDSPIGVAKSVGLGILGFADALNRLNPDRIVILGDRFEALAAAQTAMFLRIPVAHIHGGEITEGAYDDAIRHAITKFSHLHFASTEEYRNRIIQLGENPEFVFNVGAVGLDVIARTTFMSVDELSKSLGFSLEPPYFLVTYHPVTLARDKSSNLFMQLLNAFDQFPEHQLLITYPNADNGGREIISLLEEYAKRHPKRVYATHSLGQLRYLSAAKYADAVVGNSSSGIIEVPSLGRPTINIGDRQKGRLAANSVIHSRPDAASIVSAIHRGLTDFPQGHEQSIVNPYGHGNASKKILEVLKSTKLPQAKAFYDIKEFS